MKQPIVQRMILLQLVAQVMAYNIHFSLLKHSHLFLTAGEPDSSPLRGYFPKLTKRSASIDTSPSVPQDSSPPSDPWRFFSDIKVFILQKQ